MIIKKTKIIHVIAAAIAIAAAVVIVIITLESLKGRAREIFERIGPWQYRGESHGAIIPDFGSTNKPDTRAVKEKSEKKKEHDIVAGSGKREVGSSKRKVGYNFHYFY